MLTKSEKIRRSPLFYVGDKYKLAREIRGYFPAAIRRFVEPFVGGGSMSLNVNANEYFLNDLDRQVIALHQFLCSYCGHEREFYELIFSLIWRYGLSLSFESDAIPTALKQQYPKTYYAHFNREKFYALRAHYNQSATREVAELYVLLIYGFNRMLRFNGAGNFNIPVGNVDFNRNVYAALTDYFALNASRKIYWFNQDFRNFCANWQIGDGDFFYFDPPYLITFSEYNKLWNEQTELDLLRILDVYDAQKIKFAVSNVTHYKGKENTLFIEWAKKFNCHRITSNYISYHDNTVKNFIEVLITNY